MSETPKETVPPQEEEGEKQVEYMQLRNRKVMTPSQKPKKARKSKKPEQVEEVKKEVAAKEEQTEESEQHEESQPKEEETAEKTEKPQDGIWLRNRVVATPKKTKKTEKKQKKVSEPTVSEIDSIVSEAEQAVKTILEKRSVEKTVSHKAKKTESHGCMMCMIFTIFAVFAVITLIAGMFGFYAVKGEYHALVSLFDYDSILGKENAAPLKNALKRFDNLYTSLDIRMQVIFDSSVFFTACCICGLCWLTRAAIKARETAAQIDPVLEIEKRLNWRRRSIEEHKRISEKLDAKDQSQEIRINNLKLLQKYEAQIEVAEQQIIKIWNEFGQEILEVSKQS